MAAVAGAAAALVLSASAPALPAHSEEMTLAGLQENMERCTTLSCKDLYGKLVQKQEAKDAGLPEPNFKLSKEERRVKRMEERRRSEEQNREFARQKAAFAREERAYLLKYRAQDEEALRLEAAGVPFEERRPLVEAVGDKAFREAMAEQEAFEREQASYEQRLAERRKEAQERAKAQEQEKEQAKELKRQEDKLCKTSICA